MSPRFRPDFVHVRLSEHGRAFAGEGETLRIATGRFHYVFTGAQPVEVLRFAEWPQIAADVDSAGHPLFELAGDDAAPAENGAE